MVNRILNVTLLTVGLVLFGVLGIQAQDAARGSSDRMKQDNMNAGSADSRWMMKAAQGGMAEVELGNVAKDHASSDAAKMFGQHMVDDHSKANDELKALAGQKKVTLPIAVDPKDKAIMDKLSAMSGAAFDKAYIRDMIADHKKDIAEFQKEANSGKDPEVKSWAAKTLPTLQSHLQMAMDAQTQLMKGTSK